MPSALLMDPIIWVAVIGLGGPLVGAIIAGWTKKKDNDFAGLQMAVSTLREDYNRISGEVKDLRAEVVRLEAANHSGEKRNRIVSEKYSVALSVIGTLEAGHAMVKVRADADGFDLPDFPTLPEIIRVDYETRRPPVPEMVEA